MSPAEILSRLQERFEDVVLSTSGVEIAAGELSEVCAFLRNDPALAFDRLLNLSGIDYEGYDEKGKGRHRAINRYEEDGTVRPVTEPATGDLGVVYHLESMRHRHRLVLKVRLPREAPTVPSVGMLWPTALWGERETYDMYGIEFEGHPDLRRILLPEDWEGHPLRKDYQMPLQYHDVPLKGLPLAVRDEQS